VIRSRDPVMIANLIPILELGLWQTANGYELRSHLCHVIGNVIWDVIWNVIFCGFHEIVNVCEQH
jgi:hypothetical protein